MSTSLAIRELPIQAPVAPLISDSLKENLNYGFNGIAAGVNLLGFAAGNLSPDNSAQEYLEYASSFFAKCATAVQGVINAIIALEKKNIIALTGGACELPIAAFTSGYNLFLARGLSAGLNHFDSIISRTKKIDNEGKIIKNEEGKEQYYDDFRKEGWVEGFKTIYRHIPLLTKELYQKPFQRDGLFARSFYMCSCFMILGSLIAFTGLDKIGSTIRHTFGGLAGVALATDQKTLVNENNQKENQKGMSEFAMSGILWVLAAIPDVVKRFDFFSNKFNNLTELALSLDRAAGIFFIRGNQRKGEK